MPASKKAQNLSVDAAPQPETRMTRTIQLDETIEVQRPLREVFAYVSEFSRIEEWDPAVARGLRLTEGPLGVGSQFRIDMKAGFSLRYSVVEWEPERRMLMTVDSKPLPKISWPNGPRTADAYWRSSRNICQVGAPASSPSANMMNSPDPAS